MDIFFIVLFAFSPFLIMAGVGFVGHIMDKKSGVFRIQELYTKRTKCYGLLTWLKNEKTRLESEQNVDKYELEKIERCIGRCNSSISAIDKEVNRWNILQHSDDDDIVGELKYDIERSDLILDDDFEKELLLYAKEAKLEKS